MKKIAVLYYSGVGNTRRVAERIQQILHHTFQADIYSVEKIPESIDMNDYDGFVIGFPVIHTHPAKSILRFISILKPLKKPKPVYIFTTCGWYSANTLRIFAKYCIEKNLIPVLDRTYGGCPATDGILLAPFIKRFYYYPKNLTAKISTDTAKFTTIVNSGHLKLKMPRFKFYSILNYPNKLIGQLFTAPIYLHRNKCIKCEKCYRCIHHCPKLALSLSKRKAPKKTLDI